jgi:hypothetical protein
MKTKIFFFSTPLFIEIHISRKHIVNDVIRHIMTLYKRDQRLSKNSLRYPTHPDAYELRLIDDDDDYYKPLFDIAALDKNDEFGEFESLAFIEVKGFLDRNKKHMTVLDEREIQEAEETIRDQEQ